jgi:hypothetical protein
VAPADRRLEAEGAGITPCPDLTAPGAAKVGDILASTDDTEKPVAERLREVFMERAEDILDVTEKDANEAQHI